MALPWAIWRRTTSSSDPPDFQTRSRPVPRRAAFLSILCRMGSAAGAPPCTGILPSDARPWRPTMMVGALTAAASPDAPPDVSRPQRLAHQATADGGGSALLGQEATQIMPHCPAVPSQMKAFCRLRRRSHVRQYGKERPQGAPYPARWAYALLSLQQPPKATLPMRMERKASQKSISTLRDKDEHPPHLQRYSRKEGRMVGDKRFELLTSSM